MFTSHSAAATGLLRVTNVIADAIASTSLRLGGLMAVAPLGADPDPAFERLARRNPDRVGGFLAVMGAELVRRRGGEEEPGVEALRHAFRRDPVRIGRQQVGGKACNMANAACGQSSPSLMATTIARKVFMFIISRWFAIINVALMTKAYHALAFVRHIK